MLILARARHALRRLAWPIGLLIVSLLPGLAMLAGTPECRNTWFQRGGLYLQIAGFLTVFWQLQGALRKYGRPTLLNQVRGWFADLVGTPKTVAISGNATIGLTGQLYPKARRGQGDGSVTTRLEALEYNLGEIDRGIDDLRRDLQTLSHATNEKIAAEREARSATMTELTGKIEDQAVGSTDLQLLGLVLFVAGAVYGTVPADAACFFGRLLGR